MVKYKLLQSTVKHLKKIERRKEHQKKAFTKIPKIIGKSENIGKKLSDVGKGFIPHYKSSPKKVPFLLQYNKSIGKIRK